MLERLGRLQFFAGLLLLAFLAQAIWLVHIELRASQDPDEPEAVRIREGWKQWHGRGIAGAPFADASGEADFNPFRNEEAGFDTEHSPLLYLVSSAPLLGWPKQLASDWRWLPRLPFLACGVFLGASLWYVARRLCGNAGGFIALTLYCFSPVMIQASAVWHTEPEIAAAWGAFGTIFTAIAVAHTLYAPREVVLWNWRRILLLGISLAIAIGAQFSMIVLVPMPLALLLYLAPVRRQAGAVIWAAGSAAGLILLCFLFFSSESFCRKLAPRDFLGSDLARFYGLRGLQAGRRTDRAGLSCAGFAASDRPGDLRSLATHTLLRQHRAAADSRAVRRAGNGASALGRCRISAGIGSVSIDFRGRHFRRSFGNALSSAGDGGRLWDDGCLCGVERGKSGSSASRIKMKGALQSC
jgi:hypothetical protein